MSLSVGGRQKLGVRAGEDGERMSCWWMRQAVRDPVVRENEMVKSVPVMVCWAFVEVRVTGKVVVGAILSTDGDEPRRCWNHAIS